MVLLLKCHYFIKKAKKIEQMLERKVFCVWRIITIFTFLQIQYKRLIIHRVLKPIHVNKHSDSQTAYPLPVTSRYNMIVRNDEKKTTNNGWYDLVAGWLNHTYQPLFNDTISNCHRHCFYNTVSATVDYPKLRVPM